MVKIAPEKPALVLQQMTEMEILVPDNFPVEEEELEESEEASQLEEDGDQDPNFAIPNSPPSPPGLLARISSFFSSNNQRSRIEVRHERTMLLKCTTTLFLQLENRDQFEKEFSGEKVLCKVCHRVQGQL